MGNERMPIGLVVSGENPLVSLEKLRSLDIFTCQIFIPPDGWWSQKCIELIEEAMQRNGIRITVLICGFEGESYHDIATIKRTVGLFDHSTQEKRFRKVLSYSDFAKKLEIKVLQSHIGFIPEDRSNPGYKELVEVIRRVADYCKENEQSFALETGQETAVALNGFIEDVNRSNLRVNFDPANMLLYDRENPLQALDILGKYVIGVHCKDGKRPERKGELGKEYPLGEGDVGVEDFINKLKEIGYTGPLTIEREIAGEEQIKDILKAKKLLEKLR